MVGVLWPQVELELLLPQLQSAGGRSEGAWVGSSASEVGGSHPRASQSGLAEHVERWASAAAPCNT